MANVGNFPAIAALVIFCSCIVVTILLVFKPVSFRVPLPGRLGRPKVTIRYYVAPVAAVLAMLACTSMSIKDVGTGLLGNDQIKPYGEARAACWRCTGTGSREGCAESMGRRDRGRQDGMPQPGQDAVQKLQ